MIKIACIGNMNNFLFNLTRHLRDNGLDVDLLLLNEPKHFKPQSDTFFDDYKNYTKQLHWHDKPFWAISKQEIEKDLNNYNFFIGSNDAPAYLNKAKIKLNIFIPIGEDLYGYSFEKVYFNFKKTLKLKYYYSEIIWYLRRRSFPINQKNGIINSNNIVIDYVPEKFNSIFKKIRIKNKIIVANCPFIYNKEFNPESIVKLYSKSEFINIYKQLREENDFLIFYSCRHVWKNPPDIWSYKGTERLIKAVKKFKNSNPNLKFKLITFEYGNDVKESKELILECGLQDYVVWLPLTSRKELFIGLSFADVGIGEFGIGWYSYGSIFEYLSMAVPVIHYRDEEILSKNDIQVPYPMINANSSDEILAGLNEVFHDKAFNEKIKQKSIEWFEKYFIEKSLNEIIKLIEK